MASLSEQIRSALGLAKAGKVYDLSVELGRPAPGKIENSLVSITAQLVSDPSGSGKSFRSERIDGPLHHGTHVDMLDHFTPGAAVQSRAGDEASRFMAPVVCRGVLVDIAGFLGRTPADGFTIEPDLLLKAIEAQEVGVEAGDAVLIRTGKAASFADDPEAAWLSCPGISTECARMLADRGMALFGIDTASPDPLPIANWRDTVHEELLMRRQTHIIENLYLEDLANDGIKEFLFICAPLRIYRATGAWARPIAVA